MKKHTYNVFFILGIILVAISFLLFCFMQLRVLFASNRCEAVLLRLEELLPEREQGIVELYPDPVMPVLDIDGTDYCAILEVPSVNVVLPVANRWSDAKLYEYPSRYFGSMYSADLVIGGSDSAHQLAFCKSLDVGDIISLTDMAGSEFFFYVVRVDRANSAEVDWLIKEEYALTLFCKDSSSSHYIAVRCNFSYAD